MAVVETNINSLFTISVHKQVVRYKKEKFSFLVRDGDRIGPDGKGKLMRVNVFPLGPFPLCVL